MQVTSQNLIEIAKLAEKYYSNLHGIQQICDKALLENFAAENIKKQKCDKSSLSQFYYYYEQHTNKLLKLLGTDDKIISTLKHCFAEIKKVFIEEHIYSQTNYKELVNYILYFERLLKENHDDDPSNLCMSALPFSIQETRKLKEKIKEKEKNCPCCIRREQSALDIAVRQHLNSTLKNAQILLGLIKDDLESKRKLEPICSHKISHDWEELEEEEDLHTPESSSSKGKEVVSAESSENESLEQLDPTQTPLELFLSSLTEPDCDKDVAFPLAMRFIGMALHPGSRLQWTYQESLSHIHLAHHGLHVLTEALVKRDAQAVVAIIPVLIMDWHVQAEQLANFKIRFQDKPEVKGHSLVELFKHSSDWDALPPHLQIYLLQMDQALLWSRYPFSSLDRLRKEKVVPDALRIMVMSAELLKQKEILPAQLKELLEFVRYSQECALQLFLRCTPLKNRNHELEPLLKLFAPKGWVETYLIGDMKKPMNPFINYDAKSVRLIQKLLDFAHPQKKVECTVKAALQDVRHHLQRLSVNRQLAAYASHPAWHARNLMHIQWVIEQIYMARLFLRDPDTNFIHDFEMVQLRLGDQFKFSEEELNQIMNFNWGTGIHHPWQKQLQNPDFITFIHALDEERECFGLEFMDNKPQPKGKAFYNELNGMIDQGLNLAHRLLNLLSEEIEAETLPPAAIKV